MASKTSLLILHAIAEVAEEIAPDEQTTHDVTDAFWRALEDTLPNKDWDAFYYDNLKATQEELLTHGLALVEAL